MRNGFNIVLGVLIGLAVYAPHQFGTCLDAVIRAPRIVRAKAEIAAQHPAEKLEAQMDGLADWWKARS